LAGCAVVSLFLVLDPLDGHAAGLGLPEWIAPSETTRNHQAGWEAGRYARDRSGSSLSGSEVEVVVGNYQVGQLFKGGADHLPARSQARQLPSRNQCVPSAVKEQGLTTRPPTIRPGSEIGTPWHHESGCLA